MPTYRGDDYPDGSSRRERYGRLRSRLWSERASFDAHWRDLGDFLMPRRTRFFAQDRNRGDKRNQNIIDSTGRFSARTLSSGLHAGLTSPARPWLKLTTPDAKLAKQPDVKAWLHEVTQRLLTLFATTNLYNALPTVYMDLGIFGTGAMSILQDSRDLFRAYAYPIGSYALGLDHRGIVTTFCRDYELTVRQVVEEFGVQPGGRHINWSGISSTVKNLWDRGDYEESVQVTWLTMPNELADRTRMGARYLPFTSCHWETGSQEKQFLKESGFETFPVMAPRWDVTDGDSYATDCPGMTALGDVRQLQIEQKRKGQAIAKMVDPALVGPSSLRTQKTSLLPGDITYADTREGMQGLRAIHEVALNLEHLGRDIAEVQYRIQRAFYEDLFLMLARSDDQRGSQPVTAREIDERHEEKLLALGPVLERTNDELLDPLVDRVYKLMELNHLLPDIPQALDGVALKVEYISILAQAQKLVGVAAQDRFLQSTLPLVEQYPQVRHKVNIMAVVDNYADMLGVDPSLVVPTDVATANYQAEQQAAAEVQKSEATKNYADAAQKASQAPVTGDSMLARIVSNAQQQAGAQPVGG
jgi:hypothetical protein